MILNSILFCWFRIVKFSRNLQPNFQTSNPRFHGYLNIIGTVLPLTFIFHLLITSHISNMTHYYEKNTVFCWAKSYFQFINMRCNDCLCIIYSFRMDSKDCLESGNIFFNFYPHAFFNGSFSLFNPIMNYYLTLCNTRTNMKVLNVFWTKTI